VKTTPWVTLAIDSVLLTMLLRLWRPRESSSSQAGWIVARAVTTCVQIVAVIGASFAIPQLEKAWAWQSPSVDAYILVDATVKDLGNVRVGHVARTAFRLKNVSGHAVKVVAATTGCDCTIVDGLPIEIPGRQSRDIAVSLRVRETIDEGPISQAIQLHFDGYLRGVEVVLRANVMLDSLSSLK
jgi:hypothetical protein